MPTTYEQFMDKDLTISSIDRQNILNNREALDSIRDYLGVTGILLENEMKFTKQQIADFYVIDVSTIERYLSSNENELRTNGYKLVVGNELREFKAKYPHLLGESSNTARIGLFNFRSFLNLGMLLQESEKAKALRSKVLDIVIDTLNRRLGGSSKYINQREEDFLYCILKEPQYRKEFTTALHMFLDMGNYKYAYYTDEIYQRIFKEKATEYKQILKLEKDENIRDTMYSDVLNVIASFETGLAFEMEKKFNELGRKLLKSELDELINLFADHPQQRPFIDNARTKMASLDYGFRQVLHDNLRNYLQSVDVSDYERFLGNTSKTVQERIEETREVFERLKSR